MKPQKHLLLSGILAGLIFVLVACQGAGPNTVTPGDVEGALDVKLEVGDRAPDFNLPDQNGNETKLSDFRGKKNVVLAFYVLAFTGG